MSQKEAENNTKAAKTVGIMAIIILLAKAMGLLREVLVANIYGQGAQSDILNTATQIPLLFFDMVLGVAILSTFVPIFNKYIEKDGKAAAFEFANNFASLVGIIATFIAVLGIIFAQPLVELMVPGYAAVPDKVAQTAALLRILFPSIVFTAMAYIAVGILQSFGEFTIPSLISVVSNGVMIAYLLIFGNKLGLLGVTVSMLVAWVLQLVIQIPHLIKFKFKYRFKFDLKDPGLKEAALIALPVLISSWVQPLCNVINMSFGSSMGDGAVSALNWANKIYIIMVGVFAYAITNFIFPKLSRLGANENDEFAVVTRTSVGFIVFIIGIVCALFLALSEPIISVVFERGAFTAESVEITARALFYYSFGMIGYAVCEVLNKSFYALSDGKTPMIASIIGIAVNFVFAFLFSGIFKNGVGGLALASAISSIAIALCLMFMINKRRAVINKAFCVNLFKILICAGLAYLTARAVDAFASALSGNTLVTLLRLLVCALPALVMYLFSAYLFKVDEIKSAINTLRKD